MDLSFFNSFLGYGLGCEAEIEEDASVRDLPTGNPDDNTSDSHPSHLIPRGDSMTDELVGGEEIREGSPDLESARSEELDRESSTSTVSETSESSSDEARRLPQSPRRYLSKDRILKLLEIQNLYEKLNSKYSEGEITDEHIQLFAHGKFWTCLGVITAWFGMIFGVLARWDPAFVTVDSPIYIDASFLEVHEVGMINFMLCYNVTYTGMSGCASHRLEAAETNDTMFQVARSMAFLAIFLGSFLAVFMAASTFWKSINMRPIGVGLLITYFLQSFTFLLFDSNLCSDHKCNAASGTAYSIVASLCWITACIAALRMNAVKTRRRKARELFQTLSTMRSRSRSASPHKNPKTLQPKGSDSVKTKVTSNKVKMMSSSRQKQCTPKIEEIMEDLKLLEQDLGSDEMDPGFKDTPLGGRSRGRRRSRSRSKSRSYNTASDPIECIEQSNLIENAVDDMVLDVARKSSLQTSESFTRKHSARRETPLMRSQSERRSKSRDERIRSFHRGVSGEKGPSGKRRETVSPEKHATPYGNDLYEI